MSLDYKDDCEIMTTEPIKLKFPKKSNISINLEDFKTRGKDIRDLKKIDINLVSGRNNTIKIKLYWSAYLDSEMSEERAKENGKSKKTK